VGSDGGGEIGEGENERNWSAREEKLGEAETKQRRWRGSREDGLPALFPHRRAPITSRFPRCTPRRATQSVPRTRPLNLDFLGVAPSRPSLSDPTTERPKSDD
jgi:hypothetical protein